MHTRLLLIHFLTVVISITSAMEERNKRQDLLPPLEMRLQENIPGQPVLDYPIFDEVPDSRFHCSSHQFAGYYADLETRCQVFHICQFSGRQDSFLCPNGTVFDQRYFVCNWWFNVDCNLSPTFYTLNSQLFTSSDSNVLGQEFVSQDVSFDPQGSLPVPGVVGGGSVIPSPNNNENFRQPHNLDVIELEPSTNEWEIASSGGPIRRPLQNSLQRPSEEVRLNPVPIAGPPRYPSEEEVPEQDFGFPYTQQRPQEEIATVSTHRPVTIPVTTYRPIIPYVPPERPPIRPQAFRYPEESFPDESLPQEDSRYYYPDNGRIPEPRRPLPRPSNPIAVVSRRPVSALVTVTETYLPEEEFYTEASFPEVKPETIPERQRPVPLTPEEEISLTSDFSPESVSFDYDTYTNAPEPSPFDEQSNYGQRLPSTVTSGPLQVTSPQINTQQQQLQSHEQRFQPSLVPNIPVRVTSPRPQIQQQQQFQQSNNQQRQFEQLNNQQQQFEELNNRQQQLQQEQLRQQQIQDEQFQQQFQQEQLQQQQFQREQLRQQQLQQEQLQQQQQFQQEHVRQQEEQLQQQQFQQEHVRQQEEQLQQQQQQQPKPQRTQISSYPAEEDLPLEEMVPITESVLPEISQSIPFYTSTPPQIPRTPQPVPDPIQRPPPIESEVEYRSKQTLQFVSKNIPIIGQTIRKPVQQFQPTNLPETQTQPAEFPTQFYSIPTSPTSPHQQPMDITSSSHQTTQFFQFVTTPTPITELSTKYSTVSIEDMPDSAVSVGQSYVPQHLDTQSSGQVGGTSQNSQNSNLYEYRIPERPQSTPRPQQPPIKTQQQYPTEDLIPEELVPLVTPVMQLPSSATTGRPNYPTQYTTMNELPLQRQPETQPNFQSNQLPQTNVRRPEYPREGVDSPSSTPAYSLSNALAGLENPNQNNPFGPLEILSVDNQQFRSYSQPNIIPHNPTYVNIQPSYINRQNSNGQLEEMVTTQSLLSPYPQRGIINNQIAPRLPHYNQINNNNNQNNLINNNNNRFQPFQSQSLSNNFNDVRMNPNSQITKNSVVSLPNEVVNNGVNLGQGQYENGRFIPNNGFLTHSPNKPLSVPLISVPVWNPNEKGWTIKKLSQKLLTDADRAGKVRRFNVPSGGRPVVIRLASDPRVPPQIEINRRIDNSGDKKKKQTRKIPVSNYSH